MRYKLVEARARGAQWLRGKPRSTPARGVGRVGPAGGDDLAAGVEVHAVVAVDVVVAEERVLPAAEGVVADGHRDRDVHADHAGLDLQLEAAGRAAVPGEDRGAVAERRGVDEGHALLVGLRRAARTAPGRRSRRGRRRSRSARCRAGRGRSSGRPRSPRPCSRCRPGRPRRPAPPRRVTYEATLSRWAAVISGPISEVGSLPGPILIFSARSRIFSTSSSPIAPTATTAEIAMQRSPAEP